VWANCQVILTWWILCNFTPFFCIFKWSNLFVKVIKVSNTCLSKTTAHYQMVVLLRYAHCSSPLVSLELTHRRSGGFLVLVLHFVFRNFSLSNHLFFISIVAKNLIVIAARYKRVVVNHKQTPKLSLKMRLNKYSWVWSSFCWFKYFWIFDNCPVSQSDQQISIKKVDTFRVCKWAWSDFNQFFKFEVAAIFLRDNRNF
jgi:hypothetical protein